VTGALGTAPGVEVEMACWPPVRRETTSQGWVVGLSGGLTRRANSAVALRAPEAGVAAAVDEVEARYAAEGLTPVMRVGSGPVDDEVRAELLGRGWVERSHTGVLARPLTDLPPTVEVPGVRTVVAREPDEAWLDLHLDVKQGGGRRALARAILTGGDARHLAAYEGDALVGILRVARAGEWAALACLAVPAVHRRRGIGRLLTLHGLAAAHAEGATSAFLQVERQNTGAAALYGELGFTHVDEYAYLELPGAPEGSC